MPLSQREKETELYGEFGRDLYRRRLVRSVDLGNNTFNIISENIDSGLITSGNFASKMNVADGFIYSGKTQFDNTQTGFILGIDNGTAKFYIGNSSSYLNWTGTELNIAGDLTATTGTIGGFSIGSDYIRDAANSFGMASTVTGGDDVRGWAGASFANRATAPFRYTEAGAVTMTSATITGALTTAAGSSITTSYLSGLVALANTNLAAQGWTQTSAFSVTDLDTVAWGAGTFTAAEGTAYSIGAGNTGNMAARTYIYLDIAVSTTAYQTTTTAATAVGAGKVLVAAAINGTENAEVQVFGGTGGIFLGVGNIVANSTSTNEFVANTANIANAIITNAKIADLAVGKLTAGTITSKAIALAIAAGTGDTYIAAGKTDFDNTTAGFILGLDDSDSDIAKFYIGNTTLYMNWTGSSLNVRGTRFLVGSESAQRIEIQTGGLLAVDASNQTEASIISSAGDLVTLTPWADKTALSVSDGNTAIDTANMVSFNLNNNAATGDALSLINTGLGYALDVQGGSAPSRTNAVIRITSFTTQGAHINMVPIASAPATPSSGDIYANSADNVPYYYNGISWLSLAVQASRLTLSDGSDGDFTTTGDVALTADTYYDDLTIASGHTFNCAHYKLFVKGTLTVTGTLQVTPNDGGAGGTGGNGGGGAGGTGGTAGTAASAITGGTIRGTIAGVAGVAGRDGGLSLTDCTNPVTATVGNNGANITQAAGVAGTNGQSGGAGGAAGLCGGGQPGAGGTGGTVTAHTEKPRNISSATVLCSDIANGTADLRLRSSASSATGGGGGGGAGDGDGVNNGMGGGGGGSGGSGSPGGILFFACDTLAGAGTIRAAGGAGGVGGVGGNGAIGGGTAIAGGGGGGCGGSGGSGGIVIAIYRSKTFSGTMTAPGGAAGGSGAGGSAAGGGGAGNTGGSGNAGSTGTVIEISPA